MKIILGSGSVSRRRTLEKYGIVFEIVCPDIDERAIRDPDPEKLVLKLAFAKADALLSHIHKPALLITSDQVVVCNGVILEKPKNAEDARRFFALYIQYPPLTVTAVVVTNTATGVEKEGVDSSRVWFYSIPNSVIEQVIEDGSVFAWAGGYNIIDPRFIPYIKKIEGDPEGICGLPWKLTERLLSELA